MSADDVHKDELAARVLSRLEDAPVPEGLAARIAARAVATPQIGVARSAEAPASAPIAFPGQASTAPRVARSTPGHRRHFVAASIVAALLISVGVYAGFRDSADDITPLARDEPRNAMPQAETPAPARLADAARPAEAQDAKPLHREKARPAQPAQPSMTSPVPKAAPVELVAEGAPSTTTPTKEPPAEENRLAQTGPKNAPNIGLQPVYGPPAPVGLGIAGGTGGASLPGEASSGTRGSGNGNGPPSGSPPGMPGPGGPRGPGPRM